MAKATKVLSRGAWNKFLTTPKGIAWRKAHPLVSRSMVLDDPENLMPKGYHAPTGALKDHIKAQKAAKAAAAGKGKGKGKKVRAELTADTPAKVTPTTQRRANGTIAPKSEWALRAALKADGSTPAEVDATVAFMAQYRA